MQQVLEEFGKLHLPLIFHHAQEQQRHKERHNHHGAVIVGQPQPPALNIEKQFDAHFHKV